MRNRLIIFLVIAGTLFISWRIFTQDSINPTEDKITIIDKDKDTDTTLTPGTDEKNSETDRNTDDNSVENNEKDNNTNTTGTNTIEDKTDVNSIENHKLSKEELERRIIDKYKNELLALRDQLTGQLNSLIGEAKNEFLSLPENKRLSSATSLAFKYYRKAASIEKEGDKKVEAVLGRMTQELKKNNLSTEAVTTARKQYISQKGELKKNMMAKFKEFM